MDVAQVSSARTAATSGAIQNQAVLSSDFETFLTMLSTQLQNQDPLNPVDSADYAVQLATFSSVEQQVLTNNHLEALINQIQLSGMSDLAGWVGMEALVYTPVDFDGTPVTLRPGIPTAADSAVLIVRDSNGEVVLREDVPLTADSIEWDGRTLTDEIAPDGTYEFELETSSNGEVLSVEPVASYAEIAEARRSVEGTILILESGDGVMADMVLGLRQPGSA
ncbi:flagellar hook capping FlgD N-terminal domain-containing protein [Pseudooceanicola sp. C21-150M6]|uniref:flagellar hook capping FlgD N-terminal domain-containing protein n=1 Tax=Pseudooceanicola sp. C21-150M6 TaxID=3434355 RepID=UPI003D7F7B27